MQPAVPRDRERRDRPRGEGNSAGGMIVGKTLGPDYRLKFVQVYQVTALLLVDGRLGRGRQWTEREESFAS